MDHKTLIAVPCMQTVPTQFLKAFVAMRRVEDTRSGFTMCTMIHDARNEFASRAIMGGYDRVLWLDSDMVFEPDLMERLSADLDAGMPYVSALAFKRVSPTAPVIYDRIAESAEAPGIWEAHTMKDYPQNAVFRVAASGFGAVMTTVDMIRQIWDKYGPPFLYHANLGEDLSFCYRAGQLGIPMFCDSRVKVGHVGQMVFDEDLFRRERTERLLPVPDAERIISAQNPEGQNERLSGNASEPLSSYRQKNKNTQKG